LRVVFAICSELDWYEGGVATDIDIGCGLCIYYT